MSDSQELEGQPAPTTPDNDIDIPVRLIVGQWLRIFLILLTVLGASWLAQRVIDHLWLLVAALGFAFLLMLVAILLLLETVPLSLAALFVTFQKRQQKKQGD